MRLSITTPALMFNFQVPNVAEFIGYAIQPVRNIAAWFMLRGFDRNGKTDKFAVGSLAGKLLLIDDDVDTGTKLRDGFLKKVSERKLMTGQSKFKDSFEFIYTALPVMFKHIRQEGEITRRLSQIIEIGNYKFDLSCDANVNCIKLENPSTYSHSEPRSSSDDSGINPFVWICAAGLILWVISS